MDAWPALQATKGGVFCSACGSGKTIFGLLKAAEMKVPTLIVSHQKAHLDNWKKELETLFDLDTEIGWIRGDKMEYDREVVFATIQTLAKRVQNGGLPPGFFTHFGLVIFDEVHHLAASLFSLAADLVSGVRLGLTATPRRIDRQEGIVYSHLGPLFYEDLEQELDPIVYVVSLDLPFTDQDEDAITDRGGMRNISLLRSWMGDNSDRNHEICKQVIDPCVAKGRKIYALTHSKEHAETLHEVYPQSGCITGKTPPDKRLPILNSHDLVFATMNVGSEAYNRADLDTLILLTPFAAKYYTAPAFQQSVGRLQRKTPGKKDARVYIILDKNIDESRGLAYTLVREAKKQGYEVRGWNSSNRRPRRGW